MDDNTFDIDVRHHRRAEDPDPPSPLTESQLEWFAAAQQHAVAKSVRKTMLGGLVGYVVFFAAVVGVYYAGQHTSAAERTAIVDSGKVVAVDSCNRDFDKFEGIFTRLDEANKLQYHSGKITLQARQSAKKFYANELANLPDCRKAQKILTANPDKNVPIPVPRYPGDGA